MDAKELFNRFPVSHLKGGQTSALFDKIFEQYIAHNNSEAIQQLRKWEEGELVRMIPPECVLGKHVFSIGCGLATDADLAYWTPMEEGSASPLEQPPQEDGWCMKMGMQSFTGIEPAFSMKAAAQRRHSGRFGWRVCEMSIEKMQPEQFGPECYHLVFSRLTLHWVANAESAADKAYELLAPGGVFAFSVEHPEGPEKGLDTFMGATCKRYHRSAHDWRGILTQAGFKSIETFEPIYPPMNKSPYLFAKAVKP